MSLSLGLFILRGAARVTHRNIRARMRTWSRDAQPHCIFKMVDPRWQKDFSRSCDFSRNKSSLLLFDAYLAIMEIFCTSYDYENRCMLEKDLFL